jgi:hypothetical protein
MRGAAFAAGVAALAALLAGGGRASLYSPDDPFAVPVGSDGKPAPLPFDEFKRRLAVLKNLPNTDLKPNPDRERVLARIAQAQRKAQNRTPPETVALAVDLLRTGRPADAAGVLATGDRQSYLSNVTLAHVSAALGDWATASEYLTIANGLRPPAEWAGLTPSQLAWQLKVTRGPLAKLFESRWLESRHRPTTETEEPDDLFPVRFVNAAGQYQPGVLAPTEREKLPADAIAVVQQLLLWSPNDTRLYWLLGELYVATGDVRTGRRVLDDCVETGGKYGNRKVLQAHRQAVIAAADALPKEAPAEDVPLAQPDTVQPAEPPIEGPAFGLGTIGVYFGVVGALAVLALVRTVLKRR